MNTNIQKSEEKIFLARAFEVVIRVGTAALLFVWCFQIAKPFLTVIVWGIIIAVALRSTHKRLHARLGGRNRTAAVVVTAMLLLLLIVPTVMLSSTMIDSAQALSDKFHAGSFHVPPPPERIASWPIIGDSLFNSWKLASINLAATLAKMAPTLKTLGGWLVANIAGAGAWVLQFMLSIIIAGVLLANVDGARNVAQAIAARLAGEKGPELLDIAGATVRSVTRGILGVAMIQAVLGGIGMFVAGVPGAGLWSLLILLLAVIKTIRLITLI
jgi:predicted PurR-regulated permease PerM